VKQAIAALGSVITLVLVVAGIAGLAYKGFRDGGWVTTGFGKIADLLIDFPLMALGLIVAMCFSYRAWINRRNQGSGGKVFDLALYVLMAAGVYFIAQYVLRGEI
jgi:ABC-type dipeptide/oligopeptide/nickel transport system permease component